MLFAYIDAGSGTMLLQIIIAGVVAIPFFFRNAVVDGWRRIRGGRPAEQRHAGDERERG